MLVFLPSMSAAHRAAPTGGESVSSECVRVQLEREGLTRVGESEEDANEGDHLEECGNGTEAVSLLSVSVPSSAAGNTYAVYGATCSCSQADF